MGWADKARHFVAKRVLGINPVLVARYSRAGVSYDDSSAPDSPYDHLDLARENVWVYRAAQKIAASAASLPYQIWRRLPDEQTGEMRWVIREDDPWAAFLERPNPHFSWYQMVERVFLSQLYLANAYWELVGNRDDPAAFAIFPLDAKRVTPLPDPFTLVKGFEFAIPDGPSTPIPADDVLWFRLQSPFHDLDTFSPLVPLRESMRVQKMTQEWTRDFFKEGTEPDYALETENKMGEPAIKRLREDIKQRHKGPKKRREPMILDNGLKYKPTSSDPEKARLTEIENYEMLRTLVALGVPPSVIGVHSPGEAPQQILADKRFFWEETMGPFLRNFEDTLNPALPPDVWFRFDWRAVQDRMTDPAERSASLVREVHAGILMVNEARAEKGLPSVPWGNTAYLSVGLAPVDSPFRAGRTHEEIAVGFRPAGSDVEPGYTTEPAEATGAPPEEASIDDILTKADTPNPNWDDAAEVARWNLLLVVKAQVSPDMRTMRQKVRSFWEVLREAQFARLGEVVKVEKADDVTHTAALVLEAEVIRKLFEAAVRDTEQAVVAKHGQIAIKELVRGAKRRAGGGAGAKVPAATATSPGGPRFLGSIQFNMSDPAVEAYLATKIGANLAPAIQEQLRKTILEGVRQALTRLQLEQKLRDEVFGAAESEARIRAISSTEVMTAANMARAKGFQQGGATKKQWNSLLLPTTRDAHELAHGQVVPIDQPFYVGGEAMDAPLDPSASAENVVNCKCWVTVPEEGLPPLELG